MILVHVEERGLKWTYGMFMLRKRKYLCKIYRNGHRTQQRTTARIPSNDVISPTVFDSRMCQVSCHIVKIWHAAGTVWSNRVTKGMEQVTVKQGVCCLTCYIKNVDHNRLEVLCRCQCKSEMKKKKHLYQKKKQQLLRNQLLVSSFNQPKQCQ